MVVMSETSAWLIWETLVLSKFGERIKMSRIYTLKNINFIGNKIINQIIKDIK